MRFSICEERRERYLGNVKPLYERPLIVVGQTRTSIGHSARQDSCLRSSRLQCLVGRLIFARLSCRDVKFIKRLVDFLFVASIENISGGIIFLLFNSSISYVAFYAPKIIRVSISFATVRHGHLL